MTNIATNIIKQKVKYSILILYFFVVSCATGSQMVSDNRIYIGMSKQELLSLYYGAAFFSVSEDPFLYGSYRKHVSSKNKEIIAGSSKSMYFVFKDVTIPVRCTFWMGCSPGNGKLESYHFSLSDADNAAYEYNKKEKTSFITKKKTVAPKKSLETNELSRLIKLSKDYQDGKISEAEFEKRKAEILK